MNLTSRLAAIPGLAWLALCAALVSPQAATGQDDTATSIIESAGVPGGLVVHLGCGDGKLTAALRVNSSYQVHGLDRDAAQVAAARKHIQSLGAYGDVSVDRWDGKRLPYVDNMVNLLVAEEPPAELTGEILRVLVPQGVAYVKRDGRWSKTVKPRPENIDEWTHYLHDPGGNAVAHDKVVGPPKHLQWLGSPRWSRHHDRMASMSALVSTGGRIFYIMDEGSRISIQMPPRWTLIARDAFNGVVLWKRPIPDWQHHLWPLKSGPTQLARRLVAVGDRVFVTLGFTAPLTELDAATGETIRTYQDSAAAEELIVADNLVCVLANDGLSALADYVPQFNTGDQRRVFNEFLWNQKPRRVVVYDRTSGRELWRKTDVVAPLTLAADSQRLFYYDGEKVVCLDRQTGKPQWASEPADHGKNRSFNFGPKLVVHDGVMLFAGGDRTMRALDAATGKQLWQAPHARGGYQSPEDLLVAGGLVWSAPTTSGKDSGVFTGRDLKTGIVQSEFPPTVETYWFHHRCYIAKATDRFLLPSRTGIEFVDYQNENWDINHWVRGGCLYGVMPCNGLTYAPPHNCACYPEAKLYGLNALAPAAPSREVDPGAIEPRLDKGPAFADIGAGPQQAGDWPTYRGNPGRSGYVKTTVASDPKQAWQVKLSGKLSTLTVAEGKLFVAQVDQHLLHALDEQTGDSVWSFTAGGRIDSPPTIHQGRVLFGSADGWVYCLRAEDGALAWRFRAAPRDDRLMAFEQLESVWPVHGSVLVKDDSIYCVAGRSNFLDGGLRFLRLSLDGDLLVEQVIDDRDPNTGADIQDNLETLQMPSGLPDILSSDGDNIFMRSQQFDADGNRIALGPHSGTPSVQGAVQAGSRAHLFAPMGYLDDTYFHRAYWVFGRSFAGGHSGYFQAGKYAPAGRILVADEQDVYGFGRKPQYLKWTTTIEHQLFSSSKQAPPQALSEAPAGGGRAGRAARRGGAGTPRIQVANNKTLDPTGKSLTVEAWVNAERPSGVIVARGGPAQGYALVLQQGMPRFMVRADSKLATVSGKQRVMNRWVHLAGVLTDDNQLQLYVDGKQVETAKGPGKITSDPAQAMEIGADDGGAVGAYASPLPFTGAIDEVRVYFRPLSPQEIARRHQRTAEPADKDPADKDPALVLDLTFDDKSANDASGYRNQATLAGAKPAAGKFAAAMHFAGGRPGAARQATGSFVQRNWTTDIPLFARAMVLADKTLCVAGPPDLIDEEETFQKIMDRDPEVAKQLAAQDAALDGAQGGLLWIVDAASGRRLQEVKLPGLPAWDGLAAANGRLFLATTDGQVICYAK